MRIYTPILTLLAVLAGLLTTSQQAMALTATGNFNVTVNLYPKCEVTVPGSALTLSYVSFQTTASTNTADFGIKCTNTLPYTLALTGASGTLVGLSYTLSLPGTTGTGNGNSQTVSVTGTVAANQAGTCTTVQTATTGTQVASTTGANTGVAVGTPCTATSAAGAHVLTVAY